MPGNADSGKAEGHTDFIILSFSGAACCENLFRFGWEPFARSGIPRLKDYGIRSIPMMTSDRFLRFAAECEVMAKFTHSRENKVAWNRIAERWMRCAALMDKHDAQPRPTRRPARQVRQAS